MNIISKGELLNLTQQIFEHAGFTEKDANHCADVLVFADVTLKPESCITCLRARVHLTPLKRSFEFRAMSKIIKSEGEK